MSKTFIVEKAVGETPLEALTRLRTQEHIDAAVPLSYAGRLDPLASGKLLVLVGDECKKQKEYHSWRKEYDVEVLLGIASDTGDPLGLVELAQTQARPPQTMVRTVLKKFVGPYTSPYPAFSSKTVRGKPLFLWKLENKLHEIEVPKQDGRIYSIVLKNMRVLAGEELLELVREKIACVTQVTGESKELGRDFRRTEVLASWDALSAHGSGSRGAEQYVVLTIRVQTSAGVYMRTLADDIGRALGTRGLALSIHRTRIWKPLFE